MDASFSTLPSLLKTLPFPALNSGESSKILIVSITANSLDLPSFNSFQPFEIASSSLLIMESSFDLEIFSFKIIPAPPCITIAILFSSLLLQLKSRIIRRHKYFFITLKY